MSRVRDEAAKRIVSQYRAVAHLANQLAAVHSECADMFERSPGTACSVESIVGPRSAAIMETLGNILNGMDAVGDDADWLEPIFRAAQAAYPQETTP